jgi:hypothetical protein
MRGAILVFCCLAGLSETAWAEEGRHLALTIYGANLALVEDRRPIDFPAGRSTQSFPDVSADIRPETASLSADGVAVLEQNFDYDLLTPAKLIEKAVGSSVRILRTNPGSGQQTEETATVLSAQEGVVLKIGDRIEVLRDDGLPTRVVFDRVPDNLRAHPTLSVLAQSSHAGSRPATLRYMTTGLSWSADYVATFNDAAATLDLQGWVTLTNNTKVAYDQAAVRIASGAVGGQGVVPPGLPPRADGAAADRGSLFDLPEPVSIADRQSKQVAMVDLAAVPAEKVYRSVWVARQGSFFSGTGQTAKADVVLRFDAKDGSGRVWRLPRGALRAFVKDAKGDAQFIGETRIGDTAAGAKVQATVSKAFDIDITPRLVSDQKLGDTGSRRSVEYRIANASADDVKIEIEQGGLGSDAHVVDESVPGVALDAYRRQWTVAVPAHGEATLTAVIEQGR